MADRNLLRVSVILLVIGEVVVTVLTLFVHPGGGATFEATFANYAASGAWAAIHLGQFIGTAVIRAGLLVLFFALNGLEGTPLWVAFFGAVSTGVALAMTAVLYAVDGVALKQAVDAWVSAPPAEQAIRFASAQAIRWLEWGTRSYGDYMAGLSLVGFAIAIVMTARISRAVGYVLGLIGLGFLVVGWLVGTLGLQSFTQAIVGSITYTAFALWIIWYFVVAWRMKEPVRAAAV